MSIMSADQSWQGRSLQLQSPFFAKLPAELRLEIYRHAFVYTTPILDSETPKLIKALHTCKRIQEEATPIFRKGRNIFSINVGLRLRPRREPAVFSQKFISPWIKHLSVRQLSTLASHPPSFNSMGSIMYDSHRKSMKNLHSLSSITFGANALWVGPQAPSTSLRPDASYPGPQNFDTQSRLAAYLPVMFNDMGKFAMCRRDVKLDLVIFYYRAEDAIAGDEHATLAPRWVMHYAMSWPEPENEFEDAAWNLHLDFQGFLGEESPLWRDQYAPQTLSQLLQCGDDSPLGRLLLC